jgi:hypothetical protein
LSFDFLLQIGEWTSWSRAAPVSGSVDCGDGGANHQPAALRQQSDRPSLQRHNNENFKQIFPEKELPSLNPFFHIHVSVSDFYIPMIGLNILLQENMWENINL